MTMEVTRVILVGAGGLGRRWTEVLAGLSGVALVGVVDPLIGGAQSPGWLQDLPGVPQADAIPHLSTVGADCALVTAASPAHHAAVRDALEAGLHVLVEKPFVTTLADAQNLVALAAARGRTLMVSQNYRFFPGVDALRRRLSEDAAGPVLSVSGQFWCDWAGKPYQHAMAHPMALEMAVHHFDLVRAIFDAEAEDGWVSEWNPPDSPYVKGGGALEAMFRMRSGAHEFPFNYSGSLVSRASPALPWGGCWRFELAKETLFAEPFGDAHLLFRRGPSGVEVVSPFGDPTMAFAKSFGHFQQAIRDGVEPWSSGRDNLGTLRMVLGFFRPPAFPPTPSHA